MGSKNPIYFVEKLNWHRKQIASNQNEWNGKIERQVPCGTHAQSENDWWRQISLLKTKMRNDFSIKNLIYHTSGRTWCKVKWMEACEWRSFMWKWVRLRNERGPLGCEWLRIILRFRGNNSFRGIFCRFIFFHAAATFPRLLRFLELIFFLSLQQIARIVSLNGHCGTAHAV